GVGDHLGGREVALLAQCEVLGAGVHPDQDPEQGHHERGRREPLPLKLSLRHGSAFRQNDSYPDGVGQQGVRGSLLGTASRGRWLRVRSSWRAGEVKSTTKKSQEAVRGPASLCGTRRRTSDSFSPP